MANFPFRRFLHRERINPAGEKPFNPLDKLLQRTIFNVLTESCQSGPLRGEAEGQSYQLESLVVDLGTPRIQIEDPLPVKLKRFRLDPWLRRLSGQLDYQNVGVSTAVQRNLQLEALRRLSKPTCALR